MSDNESSNKDKVKPTVFYAQKAKDESPKRSDGKRDFTKNKPVNRSGYGKPSEGKRSERPRSEYRRSTENSSDDSRIETFKPRNKAGADKSQASPWKNRFQKTEQLPTYTAGPTELTESKVRDHDKIKRQRKEETIIYSENSCKAVFTHRPDAIVKAFIVQEKTYEFKALIAYLVENRLGYDVVEDEQLTKIAQTPHHGGVCLIVKKRNPQLIGDYLLKAEQNQNNCILAIDDINNPHNLGGIARTAAFFNVDGLLLRQPDILDNGAAMRVAEGGSEALSLIKADDLLASLDLFKQHGYQIVALLPCKVSSLKAQELNKVAMKNRVVFVIFQQINTKLAELADSVVYLPGSGAMSALNISVLTGIMLAKWQEKITS